VTRRTIWFAVLGCFLTVAVCAQARFASLPEVRATLATLADILPPELKRSDSSDAELAWAEWVARQDRAIRSRLQRGDEETIVNWLMLGTTFTKVPRVQMDSPGGAAADEAQRTKRIASRAADLATALATPGQDERRLFARQLFAKQGYTTTSAADRSRLLAHLNDLVASVIAERAELTREIQAIRQVGDSSDQFAARSKLFRDRGLSLDTSFRPSFALEQALVQLRQRGVLKPGAVRDVAVVGPGLDFTDKTSGYDFYPQQTLQPFALIDSLVRVGLTTDPAAVRLTTLDISPRVNDHLRRSRQRASAGQAYRIRLPLERDVSWKPAAVEYWKVAGDRVGTASPPARAAVAGANVDVRTVAVRPAVALRLEPLDLNIVVQRSDTHRFDLVVATNVFVYYDVLEQVLALSNVRAMLKPGGILLSNNALLELPSTGMRSAGYVTVEYSDVRDDGDHIVWYRAE
jgi:SAM-dependent methyltransferase